MAAVILATAAFGALWVGARSLCAQELTQHYARKPADAGPRALGLIQLSSTGKARLIPIVIMMNGKFYDAGSFKATPVPMALDFGVVYEAFRAGVSQGTLTITQPGQLNHNWIAEGTWLPAGAKPPETAKKYAPPVIEEDNKDDRPVLHRRAEGAADKDKNESKPQANSTAASSSTTSPTTTSSSTTTGASTNAASTGPANTPSTAPAPSTTSSDKSASDKPASTGPTTTSSSSPSAPSSPPSESKSASGSPPASTSPAPTSSAPAGSTPAAASKDANKGAAKPVASAAAAPSTDEPFNDPNRPRLRRGKPDANAHHEPFVDFDAVEDAAKAGASAAGSPSKDAAATFQTFPAISDAGGPDARPYTYDLKPAEEAIYRKKMLDLAASLVKVKGGQSTSPQISSVSATKTRASAATKTSASANKQAVAAKPKPQLELVNLRVFDLSNSNEPVLVLSARTPVPPAEAAGAQAPQEITLIARTDLEGELQKLFFAQTDSRHLDVSPRMELVDAVDADGDGRGELLFRQTSDAGNAYAIYRVTADGLWPLYEGAQ